MTDFIHFLAVGIIQTVGMGALMYPVITLVKDRYFSNPDSRDVEIEHLKATIAKQEETIDKLEDQNGKLILTIVANKS